MRDESGSSLDWNHVGEVELLVHGRVLGGETVALDVCLGSVTEGGHLLLVHVRIVETEQEVLII